MSKVRWDRVIVRIVFSVWLYVYVYIIRVIRIKIIGVVLNIGLGYIFIGGVMLV